jgi:hypothetical protein
MWHNYYNSRQAAYKRRLNLLEPLKLKLRQGKLAFYALSISLVSVL